MYKCIGSCLNYLTNKSGCIGSDEGSDERQMVYLFSSGSRDIYLEDIYNTLAAPPGFTIQFRYREAWIDKDIKDADSLEGMPAVPVASPERHSEETIQFGKKQTNYEYYPLRKGTIVRAEYRGGALHVYCKMSSELPQYTENHDPSSEISNLERRPREGNKDDKDDIFITTSDELNINFTQTSDSELEAWNQVEDRWVNVVEALSDNHLFDESLFFRISNLERLQDSWINDCVAKGIDRAHSSVFSSKPESEVAVANIWPQPQELNDRVRMGYVLAGGEQYQFDILLVYANEPPEDAHEEMLDVISGQSLESSPESMKLGFRTDTKKITISPQDSRKSTYSDINIKSDSSKLVTPNFHIPIFIRRNYWLHYGVYSLVILGLFLSAYSELLTTVLFNLPFDLITVSRRDVQNLFTGFGFVLVAFGMRFWN